MHALSQRDSIRVDFRHWAMVYRPRDTTSMLLLGKYKWLNVLGRWEYLDRTDRNDVGD